MTKQNKEIAQRIQMLREDYGYTVEKMAELLNTTIDEYKDHEAGKMDFPISLLENISNIFNVELSIIITGDEPKLRVYSVTRKGEGSVVKRNEEYNYKALATNFAGKTIAPFEVTVPLWDQKGPIHLNAHSGFEFEYVLEGKVKVIINDTDIILNVGDSIYFDSSFAHWMMAVGDEPAKVLAIVI